MEVKIKHTKIFLILAFYIFYFIFNFNLSADTIIDSVYSTPELDGDICFSQNNQSYTVCTISSIMGPGDSGMVGIIPDPNSRYRAYVSFELPQIPNGYEVDSVYIRLYQCSAIGNEFPGFPIWNVPGGDTMFCIMDHIDYGDFLDPSDWTKGDPGDTGTLHTNIGIISDSAEVGYRYLDITDYVLDDYTSNRDKSQYRIRFPIETDWDYLADELCFIAGCANLEYAALIVIYFTLDNSIEDNTFPVDNNFSLYPNPVKSELICKFSMVKKEEVEISLFNIKGQKVRNVLNRFVRAGDNSLTIDMKCLNEGIYLLKVDVKNSNLVIKKIVKLN